METSGESCVRRQKISLYEFRSVLWLPVSKYPIKLRIFVKPYNTAIQCLVQVSLTDGIQRTIEYFKHEIGSVKT